MDLKIKEKIALVFGSSQGLGLAAAHSLAQEGCRVILCSRNKEKLEKSITEIGAQDYIVADLSKADAAKVVVKQVLDKYGQIDIMVCNTGGPKAGTFFDVTNEDWETGFHGLWQSATSAFYAAIPSMMKAKWGRIVIVTSITAKEPIKNLVISNAFRAGLHGLVNSISKEIASEGVTINAVMPGFTKTQRLMDLNIGQETIDKIPAKRLGQPSELASLISFLCSENAAYITGQAISCDGGLLNSI
ncbi:MAG: SDR family oxidoreductase [Bacteriovoracaceae bacterium]|nr:SDR family oxidoreductase [Bacteriovoracaceae bacterium]